MTTNNIFYKECCDKFIDYVKKSHNEQTLTEQYKKGELEEGLYYIGNGKHTALAQYERKSFYTLDSNIPNTLKENAEVLALVPSYEEWQQMKAFCEEFNALDVAVENQRLKELLKECREYVVNTPVYPQGDNIKQAEIHRLVDKINEVLK